MFGEKYSFDKLQKLVTGGEKANIEFKAKLPSEDELAKTLAALANSEGGYLIIGVDDDGTLVGESINEAASTRKRVRKVGDELLPGRLNQVVNVISGGRALTLAEVTSPKEGDAPVLTARGKFWHRIGAATVTGDLTSYASAAVLQNKIFNEPEVIVFVAMSFRTEEEPALVDYGSAMERAAHRSSVRIKLKRVDQIEGDYEISQEVMNQIDESDVVLADFTLSSHNVYFEVGYARAKKKTLIQIARKNTALEFDVRNWRTLFFRNATELEELLVKAFDALKTRES